VSPAARLAPRRRAHGRAVQVDPIKPTLKAPGIELLKLKFDESLSNFGFNFNLRRYSMVNTENFTPLHLAAERGSLEAGAYTRSR